MADDERPQYQHGVGTINGTQFNWGSGEPGKYWSIPYGDYPVTPNAPTGAWAHSVGAIPINNNVIPDPQLGRNRIGIMIHSGSAPALDQLYTMGCFKVDPQDWPGVRQQILSESAQSPLYLHVQPGGVAAFTHTATLQPGTAASPTAAPAAAAVNSANGVTPAASGPSRPVTPSPGPTMFAGVNPDALGMRNNNPGNLRPSSWVQGLPGYQGTNGGFAVFDTPQNGAAALDANLKNYGSKGINTPFGIASTWAPASDNNDPTAYGGQIAKALGVGPNDKIDMTDPTIRNKVASAIGLVENGPGKSPGFQVPYAGTADATTPGTTLNTTPAAAGAATGPAAGALPGFPDKATSDQFTQGLKQMTGQPTAGDGGGGDQTPRPPPMGPAPPLVRGQPWAPQMASQVSGYAPLMYGGHTLGMSQPLQWGSAAPAAPSTYTSAGPQQAPGTTLNSAPMAQMQQLMSPWALGEMNYGGM